MAATSDITKDGITKELLRGVTFYPGVQTDNYRFDQESQFLRNNTDSDIFAVLGFTSIGGPWGLIKDSEGLKSIVNFAGVSARYKTIDDQGKGTGPRFGNTPEVPAGQRYYLDDPIYVFEIMIQSKGFIDWRDRQPKSSIGRVAEQSLKHVLAKRVGVEEVVNRVHKGYGDAALVEIEVPPQPLHRIHKRGLRVLDGITLCSIIQRNEQVKVREVGSAKLIVA